MNFAVVPSWHAAKVAAARLRIAGGARPYLVAQRGRIADLAASPKAWLAAYRAELVEQFISMAPQLPAKCARILDVGGGMGGLNVLLAAHYAAQGQRQPQVRILDGVADPPPGKVAARGETFSHAGVAAGFLAANGVGDVWMLDPADPGDPAPADLVVSLAAWGFHFPPAAYLDFVLACCHAETRLILDVREGRYDWMNDLWGGHGLKPAPFRLLGGRVMGKFARVCLVRR